MITTTILKSPCLTRGRCAQSTNRPAQATLGLDFAASVPAPSRSGSPCSDPRYLPLTLRAVVFGHRLVQVGGPRFMGLGLGGTRLFDIWSSILPNRLSTSTWP